MSSKRAMKQAQKQAYAKHRSNITNSRLGKKNKVFIKNKKIYSPKKDHLDFVLYVMVPNRFFCCISAVMYRMPTLCTKTSPGRKCCCKITIAVAETSGSFIGR